jgi:hypothetical protein
MNTSMTAASEIRRLTRRLHAAVSGTAPTRDRPMRRVRPMSASTRVAPRAAAGGGVKIAPGIRVGPVGRLLVRILNH